MECNCDRMGFNECCVDLPRWPAGFLCCLVCLQVLLEACKRVQSNPATAAVMHWDHGFQTPNLVQRRFPTNSSSSGHPKVAEAARSRKGRVGSAARFARAPHSPMVPLLGTWAAISPLISALADLRTPSGLNSFRPLRECTHGVGTRTYTRTCAGCACRTKKTALRREPTPALFLETSSVDVFVSVPIRVPRLVAALGTLALDWTALGGRDSY